MRIRHLLFWIPAVALLLGAAAPPAAEPDRDASDEQVLREARLGTDGPALLEYFRKRTRDADLEKIKILIRQLGDDSFELRERASADLATVGSAAAQLLRQALASSHPEVVRRAEECLRRIQADTLTPAAARLLAKRKPAGAAEALLAYLPFAEDESTAAEVRRALAGVTLRDGKADPAVLAALADPLPLRRGAAAEAVCGAGAADHLPAVRKLLQDGDVTVRLRAALALAPLKEKDAVPVLIDLLAELPPAQTWPVEDVLYTLADEKAPLAPAAADPASRKKYRDAWSAWWQANAAATDLGKLTAKPPLLGHTLVVLLDAGKIIDLDVNNKVRFEIGGLLFPLDAQALPGDRVLIAEHGAHRISERTKTGEVVWQKAVEEPLVGQRLPNGNTFIATRQRLLEVDRDGKEVFTYSRPNGELFMKAQKLRNGDIACVTSDSRYVRLDATGKELHAFLVDVRTYGGRIDVLPNGRVLVPLMSSNRVVEMDPLGKVVWEAKIEQPIAAVRLPNGNTLVTTYHLFRAVEIDPTGKEVWKYDSNTRVTRAFRR